MHGNRMDTLQSKLDACQSNDQDAVISGKELELCREKLSDEQLSKEQLNQNLRSAQQNLQAAQKENRELKIQSSSEKAEIENLRNKIRQLENEKLRMKSESSRSQRETATKIRGLTYENQNLQKFLDRCESTQNMICKGAIVGDNGLSLLKKPSEIEICQDYGIYEKPENSLLMFDFRARDGNDELAVITRGLSSYSDKTGDYYKIGNKDKIITSFNTTGDV